MAWQFCKKLGPREVVVDDVFGVAVVAFHATACVAHPCVVHGAGKNTEVEKRSAGYQVSPDCCTALTGCSNPNGNELASLGRDFGQSQGTAWSACSPHENALGVCSQLPCRQTLACKPCMFLPPAPVSGIPALLAIPPAGSHLAIGTSVRSHLRIQPNPSQRRNHFSLAGSAAMKASFSSVVNR